MAPPERPPRRGPDLLGIGVLLAVLGLTAGAYLAFPWAQRQLSYQACIASGQITGC